MLYVFCVLTICIAECSGKEWSGAEVGVLHFRLFHWIAVVFFSFWLIFFVCMTYEAETMAQPVKSPADDTEAPTDWVWYIDLQSLEKLMTLYW